MSISKISFTAENSLLNKMYNNVSQQAPVTTTPTNVTEETAEKPKSHKVRNWSIGLSSAAVLISIGVLGRKGKLGEGVQKFLGGVKKNTSDLAEELETKGEELVEGKKPEIKPETPAKPQTGESIRINGKLSKAEIDKINAGLDRTIPQIDENRFTIELSEKITQNQKGVFVLDINDLKYAYTQDGKLSQIWDFSSIDGTQKVIIIDNKKVVTIEYLNKDHDFRKTEKFIDGKLAVETFFHGADGKCKTEVIHELG